ncbi:MAG: hypothetical protein RIR85_470, partial [Pseudomonadota bacterium]
MGFKVLNYELSKLDQPPHRKLEGKNMKKLLQLIVIAGVA